MNRTRTKIAACAAVSAVLLSGGRVSADARLDPIQTVEAQIAASPDQTSLYEYLGTLFEQSGVNNVTTFVNGTLLQSDVPSFEKNGRTLVPLRAISEALSATVGWDESTQTVTLSRDGTNVQLTIGSAQAYVNGSSVTLDVPAETDDDRTMVPVRFISEAFGANVKWVEQGQIVVINGNASDKKPQPGPTPRPTPAPAPNPVPSPPPVPDTQSVVTQLPAPVALQNGAQDDSSYWKRAGKDFYVSARTGMDFSGTASILNAKPDQTLYLLAYFENADADPNAQWFVNSDAASIGATPDYIWSYGSHTAAGATFTASKPGIYTVQALSNGKYSVPLVVIVGMDSLKGDSIQINSAVNGIQPLPSGLVAANQQASTDGMTYSTCQPKKGWLPIQGKVTNGASTVVVNIQNDSDTKAWAYTLPVAKDGTYGAFVRVPWQGDYSVSLIDDYLTQMQKLYWISYATYSIHNGTSDLNEPDQALLASQTMDFNLNDQIHQAASILMENAPTKMAGMAAISNYVSEKVVYDYATYNAGKFIWKDAYSVWQKPIGVCQDFAELAASLFKSIGIPAETISGTAPKSGSVDNHEWIRVWDGQNWVIMDPTWNSGNRDVNLSLTSEYMTDTQNLEDTHTIDKIGRDQ